jgi:hypothetical protein
VGSFTLTTWHPLSAKVSTNLSDKRRSLGRYSSLAGSDHRVFNWLTYNQFGDVVCTLSYVTSKTQNSLLFPAFFLPSVLSSSIGKESCCWSSPAQYLCLSQTNTQCQLNSERSTDLSVCLLPLYNSCMVAS